jgi:DNA-binding transcriptional LysR family regulator
MDRLHSMRVFARVIDEGSFAAAARSLNMSPAVVTRLVADLEDHLGARLINRTTRRLALTDTGELYLERVRQILTEVDEAEAMASAATSQPHGHLRVLAPPAFAVHQLAWQLPRFRTLYPKLTIELSAPGPVVTVDENYDLSILLVEEPLLGAGFVARRLACSAWILCASPEYLKAHGGPRHPDDLQHHHVIAPSVVREVTFHRKNDGAGPAESVTLVPRRSALSTSHIDTLHAVALAGLGIVGLPSFVASRSLQQRALVRVMDEWETVIATIYAAMPTRKHVPARTRALLDFMVQTFGGTDDDPWLPKSTRAAGEVALKGTQ